MKIKKDPAHLSDLIFRSFVLKYSDVAFKQMIKVEFKACFFHAEDIGNKPHKMPTLGKGQITCKLEN